MTIQKRWILKPDQRRQQAGMVLAMTLFFMSLATLLALAGMSHAWIDERIAGNQRAAVKAFMAAETGSLRLLQWWAASDAWGVPHEQLHWGLDATQWPDVLAEVATGALHSDPAFGWALESLEFNGDELLMQVVGAGAGSQRRVQLHYQRPSPAPALPPLTLADPIEHWEWSDPIEVATASAQVEDELRPPWVQVTQADTLEHIRQHTTNGIGTHPDDVVHSTTSGFDDPERVQALVTALAEVPGAYDGPVPLTFGQLESPAITIVRGAGGEARDLHWDGDLQGHGILVVTGGLYLDRVPEFAGLILVLGGEVVIGGAPAEVAADTAGHLQGALVMRGIEAPEAEAWTARTTPSRVQVQGALDLQGDAVLLGSLGADLPEPARGVWQDLFPVVTLQGRAYGWSEWLGLY